MLDMQYELLGNMTVKEGRVAVTPEVAEMS